MSASPSFFSIARVSCRPIYKISAIFSAKRCTRCLNRSWLHRSERYQKQKLLFLQVLCCKWLRSCRYSFLVGKRRCWAPIYRISYDWWIYLHTFYELSYETGTVYPGCLHVLINKGHFKIFRINQLCSCNEQWTMHFTWFEGLIKICVQNKAAAGTTRKKRLCCMHSRCCSFY